MPKKRFKTNDDGSLWFQHWEDNT